MTMHTRVVICKRRGDNAARAYAPRFFSEGGKHTVRLAPPEMEDVRRSIGSFQVYFQHILKRLVKSLLVCRLYIYLRNLCDYPLSLEG